MSRTREELIARMLGPPAHSVPLSDYAMLSMPPSVRMSPTWAASPLNELARSLSSSPSMQACHAIGRSPRSTATTSSRPFSKVPWTTSFKATTTLPGTSTMTRLYFRSLPGPSHVPCNSSRAAWPDWLRAKAAITPRCSSRVTCTKKLMKISSTCLVYAAPIHSDQGP